MSIDLSEEEGLCMDNFQWNDDVQHRFENRTPPHDKFYEITMSESVDGAWIVQVFYGRIGTVGQLKSFGFLTKAGAHRYVDENIQKRLQHGYKEVTI